MARRRYRCGISGCAKRGKYCEKHYEEAEKKVKFIYRVLSVMSILAITGLLWWWYLAVNVNEDKFCEDKINGQFENTKGYTIYRYDELLTAPKCQADYLGGRVSETRDGLEFVNTSGETKTDVYKLIDEKDIKQLRSDNLAGWILLVWLVIFGMVLINLLNEK